MRGKVHPGETWLDVGAHYGYTTIALAGMVGQEGNVFAFEPSVTTAGYLNETCYLNHLGQVTVVPMGLGMDGDIRIVRVPINRGMADHAIVGSQHQNIYVVGLDILWSKLGDGPIHGIKIDVQGMEAQVLEGMSRILRNDRPHVVLEFHAGVDRDHVLKLLVQAGFGIPGTPLQPLDGEVTARYCDDRSYAFEPL
jgi:FkbM family methyltransferase